MIALVLCSCKNDEEQDTKEQAEFFPVLSYLKGQVAHIDTSVYSIVVCCGRTVSGNCIVGRRCWPVAWCIGEWSVGNGFEGNSRTVIQGKIAEERRGQ